MYKKIIISTVAFLVLGFAFMAFYGFGSYQIQDDVDKKVVQNEFEPVVVLELFTSQGCSSCPAADALLKKFKNQYPDKVFALSYHVDYWNYIGWQDPFSKSVYTKKQSEYNRKLGYRGNYTPQVVVNGKEHFVGSSTSKMASKTRQYGNQKSKNKINLGNVVKKGNVITFDYDIEGGLSNKELRAVLVLDERTTSISRGENRDRTLTNSNIVVTENYIDLKESSGSSKLVVPSLVGENDETTLMLIVESDNLDITGATKTKV